MHGLRQLAPAAPEARRGSSAALFKGSQQLRCRDPASSDEGDVSALLAEMSHATGELRVSRPIC